MCLAYSLLGVEVSTGGAEMFILNSTLQSPRTSGIMEFANRPRLWSQHGLDEESFEAIFFLGKHRHQAPRAFPIFKWKTCDRLAGWRRHLAVSHTFHLLGRTSRLIERCMSLLLREFHVAFPLLGSPCMIFSRDMHFMMRSRCPGSLSLWERDIDNAFWSVDKDRVLQGIKQACRVVKTYRKIRGEVFFSFAKGNQKSLDRMGKATARHSCIVSVSGLLSLVKWDIKENNLFNLLGHHSPSASEGRPHGGIPERTINVLVFVSDRVYICPIFCSCCCFATYP